MKHKTIDPARLDMAAFAADAGELAGQWPLASLARLSDLAVADQLPGLEVAWQAEGESRPVSGGKPEIWLHLDAQAHVLLCCQRCLGPVFTQVAAERSFRFVATEAEAEALDAELEDDVLVLERAMNLRDLVEDELLLALPLVPRHEVCPEPLPSSTRDELPEDELEKPNPFAALARLKQRPQ